MICQLAQVLCYFHVDTSRYSFREKYHPHTLHKRDHVRNDVLNKDIIYNNGEFLSVFRVTRCTFMRLLALEKDNQVHQGQNSEKQSKHFVPEVHLLVTLKNFGAEGNQGGSKRLHENLGMGRESVSNYVERGVKAILSL